MGGARAPNAPLQVDHVRYRQTPSTCGRVQAERRALVDRVGTVPEPLRQNRPNMSYPLDFELFSNRSSGTEEAQESLAHNEFYFWRCRTEKMRLCTPKKQNTIMITEPKISPVVEDSLPSADVKKTGGKIQKKKKQGSPVSFVHAAVGSRWTECIAEISSLHWLSGRSKTKFARYNRNKNIS